MDRRFRKWLALLDAHQALWVFASSTLAVLLLAGRMGRSHTAAFTFLPYNLALAYIPWLLSISCGAAKAERRWLFLPLWLLFFPNAPYLVTDFVHLRSRPPVPVWYDVGMLTAFAWAGLLLAVTSLSAMHSRVERALGRGWGWAFVALVSGLSGFGIYLGRFLRKNSWDVLIDPFDLAHALAAPVLSPVAHFRTWLVAALFGSLMLVVYGAFRSRPAQG